MTSPGRRCQFQNKNSFDEPEQLCPQNTKKIAFYIRRSNDVRMLDLTLLLLRMRLGISLETQVAYSQVYSTYGSTCRSSPIWTYFNTKFLKFCQNFRMTPMLAKVTSEKESK